jgi:membrane-associated phospholipid phosphatase
MTAIDRFDKELTKTIQSLPEAFHPWMSLASFFGEPVIISLVALFTAGVAWRQHQVKVAQGFIAGLAACGVAGVLKYFVHRTRPHTMYVRHMRFKTYSFPSGHSFASLLIYGLLAYLAFQHLPSPWSWIVVALFSVLIFTVGVSRVYLGAHFPTDVIAGWILAAISLLLIIKFFFG